MERATGVSGVRARQCRARIPHEQIPEGKTVAGAWRKKDMEGGCQ